MTLTISMSSMGAKCTTSDFQFYSMDQVPKILILYHSEVPKRVRAHVCVCFKIQSLVPNGKAIVRVTSISLL